MSQVQSVGVIIDGNRRWAKERNLNPWDGHREGVERVRDCVRWAQERGGITDIFFYTLSTENWKRDPKEIDYLLGLIQSFFEKHLDELHKENVRIRIAGQRERFSKTIQDIFAKSEQETASNTGINAWFGLSYGGRAELVEGINKAVAAGTPVTEESFQKMLWTAEMPDPDVIIRTGGDQRLSNFLTWGSVYSELSFTPTQWPAFTQEEFNKILDECAGRERRKGA